MAPPSNPPLDAEPPLILLAIMPDLADQILRPADIEQLASRASVQPVQNPVDLSSTVPDHFLARTEVVMTGWGTQQIDLALAQRMPRLRAVVHTGGSVRKVVTQQAMESGILVSTQAATNAEPVADYTHAMVTLSLKGIFRSAEEYRRERSRLDVYTKYRVPASHVPTVGVVGASRIGRSVIARLKATGIRILLYDPYCHDAEAIGATMVSLEDLFAGSDVVTLHAPGTDETRNMVTGEHLGLMPDGATLINTARGSVVDGRALEAELASGRIRGILDVTEPPVPPTDSRLWDLPNVLLTPHMAGAVGPELAQLGRAATAEVIRHFDGEPMLHLVTPEQFLRSA